MFKTIAIYKVLRFCINGTVTNNNRACSVMSNSSRPHGLQPNRLLHPWDSPGKSTGVGCHCLLRQGLFTSLQIDGETMETVRDLFS